MKAYTDLPKKQIDFDDDIVIVYDEFDNVIYKGVEDYEPMKDCNWVWKANLNLYQFENYIKICLDV